MLMILLVDTFIDIDVLPFSLNQQNHNLYNRNVSFNHSWSIIRSITKQNVEKQQKKKIILSSGTFQE